MTRKARTDDPSGRVSVARGAPLPEDPCPDVRVSVRSPGKATGEPALMLAVFGGVALVFAVVSGVLDRRVRFGPAS